MIQTEAFEALASSYNGITKLRQLILELAVRGLLVPQDPNDEPASILLEKIAEEKVRLVKEGKIKKQNPLPKINEEEKPFQLPAGWKWVRLGTALKKITDGTHHSPPNGEKGEYLYISAKNIKSEGIMLSNATYVTREVHDEIYSRCNPEYGDLLYIKDGATTGIVTINNLKEPFSMLSSVALLKVPKGILNSYLLLSLRSPYFYNEMRAGMTGVAITRVTLNKLDNAIISIPSLAEQHRIVAKVDELMALCDQLEQRQNHSSTVHQRLLQTLLESLTQAVDNEAFQKIWSQIAAHFDTLFTTEASVDQLKQVILQLAVMGKLVPQDSNDEPATELIKRIQLEKTKLVTKGKYQETDNEALVKEELPFTIKNGWCWSRLAVISRRIHYGYTASANQKVTDVRLLRITDIQNNAVNWSTVPGCEISEREIDQYRLESGDILVARTGGTVGKTFLVKEIPVQAVFASYLIRIQGSSELSDQYLKLFMESPTYWKQLQDGTRGGAQPNVNGQTLGKMVVPLPPLAEQYRIIAKVDELMAICDLLKSRINKSQQTQEHLAIAIVEKAVA